MKDEYEHLLDYLAFRESSNNYEARNFANYLGKYQMGEYALEEAGYYYKPRNAKYNNDWKGTFTGKDGVYSVQDYLNNKRAQENAVRAYHKKSWERFQNSNIEQHLGKVIKGIEISPAAFWCRDISPPSAGRKRAVPRSRKRCFSPQGPSHIHRCPAKSRPTPPENALGSTVPTRPCSFHRP